MPATAHVVRYPILKKWDIFKGISQKVWGMLRLDLTNESRPIQINNVFLKHFIEKLFQEFQTT